MPTKKPSGRNVREDERSTVQVKLRLDPAVAWELRELAASWKVTLGEVIESALDALRERGRK